jgi:hypothetical protein
MWRSQRISYSISTMIPHGVLHVGVGGHVPPRVAEAALDRLERIDYSRLDDATCQPIIADIQTVLGFWTAIRVDIRAPSVYRIVTNRRVRGQIENCRLHRVAELKYPPKEKCGIGRANWKQDSVLYGCLSKGVGMAEVKPQAGELITHSEWESIATSDVLAAISIFDSDDATAKNPYLRNFVDATEKFLETVDVETSKTMRRVSKFVTAQFTRPMISENKMEYLVSAVVSKHFVGFPDIVDAIIYPSVALTLFDLNIAIRPDSFDRVYYLRKAKEALICDTPRGSSASWLSVVTAATSRHHLGREEIVWDEVTVPEEDIPNLRISQYLL